MTIKLEITNGRVPVKIYTADIEPQAYQQLLNISQLPIIHSHIAAMPDVHLGIGATVGSVIPTKKAIIPAAVGVDIGCGMNAVRLSLTAAELPDSLSSLRFAIESVVPVGFDYHKNQIPEFVKLAKLLQNSFNQLLDLHPTIGKMIKNVNSTWVCQLGTLGGGNHFIELCIDEEQNVWVMLHSGSRGIGNVIGRYFIQLAKQDMQQHLSNLPDKDLAYFKEGNPHFDHYVFAVEWAQHYAQLNRQAMMTQILRALQDYLPPFKTTKEAINCHHNYVSYEEHFGEKVYVTRKGAISARAGELGIIPGSMGVKSYIVKGKGNKESFHSCAHGAGRRLSRNQAKKQFNLNDLRTQTEGVECRKDKSVLDEIPQAYKPIDEVMKNQEDLIEIVHELKQVVCVKG